MSTQTHYARRRSSRTLHIITNVHGWHESMYLTTECGVPLALVLEEVAVKERLSPLSCKRCAHILGWDLRKLPPIW